VWLPMRNRFDRLFEDVGAKFVLVGTVWYFITCIQGPFQSLPSVQRVTHFTQWVISHSHVALLGFGGFIAIGSVYFLLPLVGRTLYSSRLAEVQFWLMLIGLLGMFLSLTFAGLIQGESWLNGEDVYRVLPTLRRYFLIRGISGLLIVAGGLIFSFNVIMTLVCRACRHAPAGGALPRGTTPGQTKAHPGFPAQGGVAA